MGMWCNCIECIGDQPEPTDAMTEGELRSWVRSVMSQGAGIRCDYDQGVHDGYEAYSARLDAAAAERAEELLARLKTHNAGGEPETTAHTNL